MITRTEYIYPDGHTSEEPPRISTDADTYLWVYPHSHYVLRNKRTGERRYSLHIRMYELERWEEIPDNSR